MNEPNIEGTLKWLLATKGKDNPWIEAALSILKHEGRNDAHSRVELSKDRVLSVYEVRKETTSEYLPETSRYIGKMLKRVESKNIDVIIIHAVLDQVSKQYINIFTDKANKTILGAIPVPIRDQ